MQGWDRLGWDSEPVELWMQLRDRRGPLAAILLVVAYLLVCLVAVGLILEQLGLVEPPPTTPLLSVLFWINFVGLAGRFAARACFTAREYGWRQGLLAIPRTRRLCRHFARSAYRLGQDRAPRSSGARPAG